MIILRWREVRPVALRWIGPSSSMAAPQRAEGPGAIAAVIGPPGPQGPVGSKGDTGASGPKGAAGDRGAQGEKGDQGEAFKVNAIGTLAERLAYDTEAPGFSYLATDTSLIYFRLAEGGWSVGVPFGKGDQGDEGPQGLKGDKGDPGDEGPQGPAGADGAPGSDATVTFATKEEVWAGAVTDETVAPSVLKGALEFQALALASNVATMNCHAGINFTVPQLTANATLANPTNKVDGRDGKINFSYDASARTLSLGSDWKKFAASPAIPTAANSKFTIVYSIIGTDVFYSVLVKP